MKRQNAETDKAFRILDICNELLNWILMIILVILFCYGTYGIGDSYMLEENAMPEQYEIYRPTEEDYGDFDELKAQNSDVCGWITIYGTHVDYPVVQSEDNSTYLMRNPRGEYSLSGSIFLCLKLHLFCLCFRIFDLRIRCHFCLVKDLTFDLI